MWLILNPFIRIAVNLLHAQDAQSAKRNRQSGGSHGLKFNTFAIEQICQRGQKIKAWRLFKRIAFIFYAFYAVFVSLADQAQCCCIQFTFGPEAVNIYYCWLIA